MFERIWYKVRWWRWFLSAPHLFPLWMYEGITRLDADSRRVVRARLSAEWTEREPSLHGKYPNRKSASE